jgi:hypothetical protein
MLSSAKVGDPVRRAKSYLALQAGLTSPRQLPHSLDFHSPLSENQPGHQLVGRHRALARTRSPVVGRAVCWAERDALRRALLRMAAGGLPSFRLMTPVGVLPFASDLSSRTSLACQGSPECRLYFAWAFRGPFFPMGEPGLFHGDAAMIVLLSQGVTQHRFKGFETKAGQALS